MKIIRKILGKLFEPNWSKSVFSGYVDLKWILQQVLDKSTIQKITYLPGSTTFLGRLDRPTASTMTEIVGKNYIVEYSKAFIKEEDTESQGTLSIHQDGKESLSCYFDWRDPGNIGIDVAPLGVTFTEEESKMLEMFIDDFQNLFGNLTDVILPEYHDLGRIKNKLDPFK